MGKIIFSVVTTVLNEEESICPLLDTLINQSVVPGEIIIVDAGSNDRTVELIKQKVSHSVVPIKCMYSPGISRSAARNDGIRQAVYQHIAVTDAGCEVDRDWLKYLQQGFGEGIGAVAGFYLPKVDQPIQAVFSRFTCVSSEAFNHSTFLPSSRSIAFTKQAWQRVGGYPEELDTCEDLVFAKRLFDTGKMTVANKAIVYWRQADNLQAYFKQIAGYARGDVEAGYKPHVLRIVSVWGRYVAFLVFPPLFILYAIYVWFKFRIGLKQIEDAVTTFLVQITTDWAVMSGSVLGLVRRLKR